MKSQNVMTKFTDLSDVAVANFYDMCACHHQIDSIVQFLTSAGRSMSFGHDCPISPLVLIDLTGDIIDIINLKVKEHYEKVSKDSENNMDCD